MKKIIICFLLAVVSAATFSQETNNTPIRDKQFYLKKSKGQKTAAWILLGAGATMLAIAAPGEVSFDLLPTLVIGGSAAIVGSIPLFIAARKNKRKAMSVTFKMQTLPQLTTGGLVKSSIPSINFKLGL